MIDSNTSRSSTPRAAYVHIPFCVSKCYYCDFNSYPYMDRYFNPYVGALISEITRTAGKQSVADLDTVYIGGGTPTVLSPEQLCSIISAIGEGIGIAEGAEITIEANPGTVDELKLVQLIKAKFNRLSLGVQSLDDRFLKKIGRAHTVKEAVDAYKSARSAGFSNIGIDLIFALPGQTVEHWNNTLEQAVCLDPEHISLYELSIEEDTVFAGMCADGLLEIPGEDDRLEMYEITIEKLKLAGYEQYEVSNFAKPGCRSRHNQVYWRNESYYGFGAGATSYVGGVRACRIGNPAEYISLIESGSDAVEFSESLTGRALLAETIILGLRMLDGIDVNKIKAQTGTDVLSEFHNEICKLKKQGLVEVTGSRLKVTHKGLLLLNNVSEEFIQV